MDAMAALAVSQCHGAAVQRLQIESWNLLPVIPNHQNRQNHVTHQLEKKNEIFAHQ